MEEFMESADFQTTLVYLLFLVVFALVLRKVNNWYWRINEIVTHLEDQNYLLQQLLKSEGIQFELPSEKRSKNSDDEKKAETERNEPFEIEK